MILGFPVPNNYFAPWQFVRSVLLLPQKYRYLDCQSHSVPDNRNRIWDMVKSMDDDLLFVDTDMTFTPEDVEKIEKHLETLDIVTGVYLLADGTYALMKRGEEDYEFVKPEDGIYEIDACGAGFLGISKRVIAHMEKNPFSNFREGEILHGEDVSFCHRAKEAEYKIHCDSSIVLGHIRTRVIKP